jgi:SAM-dependent methyltransferase
MGRRTIAVDEQERWVFNRLAPSYRNRPAYPEILIRHLSELAGGAGGRVLDLGAGTGHLAVPLAGQGHRVTAVEPARAMLAELKVWADGQKISIAAVNASAEHTGLPDGAFDLVLAADVLHWLDPELAGREVARLLRSGGLLVVIEAQLGDTPFMRELRALFSKRNPRAQLLRPSTLTQFFSPASDKGVPRVARFAHEAPLDEELLDQLLQSLTFIGPALGAAGADELRREANQLLRSHPSAAWRRDLVMTWIERARPRTAEGRAKS